MDLQSTIIVTTFFIGVALAVCGVIAVFKNVQKGSGKFRFMGAEFSGTGGVLLLLVSLVLLMSAFGWASSNKQTIACAKDKDEVVAEAKEVHQQLQQEVQLRQKLVAEIPAATKSQIEMQNPQLLKINPVKITPKLSMLMAHPVGHN